MTIKEATDDYLIGRLNEIDGEFTDFYISGYKSSLLIEEQKLIKNELKRRGVINQN